MRHRAIIALLLVCLACKREEPVRHDDALKATLARMRAAIGAYQKDHGRYPYTLEDLVPQYLPSVPIDPVTRSAKTWRVSTQETVQVNADFSTSSSAPPRAEIIDVHSGAGAPYSGY